MIIKDFKLKSGAELHVNSASFEDAVTVMEAVRRAAMLLPPGSDIIETIANADVRRALYATYPKATYNKIQLSPELFNDSKIGDALREDYFEICTHLIDVNVRPFFLKISSASTIPPAEITSAPKQP